MTICERTSVLVGNLKSALLAMLFLAFSSPCLANKNASEPDLIRAIFGGVEVSLPIFRGVGIQLPESEIFFIGGLEDIRKAYSKLNDELVRHGGVLPIVGYGVNTKTLCELAEIPACKIFDSSSSVSLSFFSYSLFRPDLKYSTLVKYARFCNHDIKWIAIEGRAKPESPEKYIAPGTLSFLFLLIDETILVRVLASNLHGGYKDSDTEIVAKNAAEFAACVLFSNIRN